MNDNFELVRLLAKLDSRLEHLERDLCDLKGDTKFKQLLIVVLLSSILGINLIKSVAIRSLEGLINDNLPTVQPNQSER